MKIEVEKAGEALIEITGNENCSFCKLPNKFHTQINRKFSPAGSWSECFLHVLIVDKSEP